MESLRLNNEIKVSNKDDLIFQIVDIKSFDESIDESESSSNSDEDDKPTYQVEKNTDRYIIMIFGIDQLGRSVSVKVDGFEPYFFVYIPEITKKKECEKFVDTLKSNLPKKYQHKAVTDFGLIKRKKFVGFCPDVDKDGKFIGNKHHVFIYLKFRSKKIMQLASNILSPRDEDGNFLKGKRALDKLKSKKFVLMTKPELYESNIDSTLRFLHIKDLQSCGWIKCQAGKYNVNKNSKISFKNTFCQIDVSTHWKNIYPVEKDNIGKMIVASYDIEADSSHGDFPVAKKGYKKLAANVFDIIRKQFRSKTITNEEIKPQLKEMIAEAFIQESIDKKYDVEIVYSKHQRQPSVSKLDRLVDLIENLFILEEGCHQLVFNGANFKKSNRIKFSYYHPDENKYPQREIQLVYVLKNDHFEYILKPGDIISKKQQGYKLIHNKEHTKYNVISKLELQLRIYDKNEQSKRWGYTDYQDKDSVSEILNEFYKKNIIIDSHLDNIYDFENCFEIFKTKRDLIVDEITATMNRYLPKVEGDQVIQIGTVIINYGDPKCSIKHMVTLNGCDPIPGCIVESCNNERDVIIKWAEFINKLDPDIIIGYNIFGFDYKFIWERAEELDCTEIIGPLLTRIKSPEHYAYLETQKLSSAGLGDNELYYINMPGRVQVDLYKIAQRDHKLDSYKLDFVSSTFINGSIKKYQNQDNGCLLKTDNIVGLIVNNYITIGIKTLNGIEKYNEGQKYKILEINLDTKELLIDQEVDLDLDSRKYQWGLAKDDVGPKDIFRLQKGSDSDRAIVAKYCVMDCELVINLANKLDIITNNIGMANVCSVPLSFIFLRGQGIKIFSLVAKQCRSENTLIPVAEKSIDSEEKDGYEGAIVLKPKPGIYLDSPVAVLDYSSLYPSSMISENLSHDTQVDNPLYLGDEGAERLKKMGLKYEDITYDNYKYIPKGKSFVKVINKDKPTITCRYVQPLEEGDGAIDDKNRGIVPRILIKLLTARKTTRKKIPTEPDIFKKAVLDGLQLAYKVTANSLYGSLGAKTSPVFKKDIAASTTATGRKLLYFAKDFVEKNYPGADTVYGDTDSVFISFKDYIISQHGSNLSSDEMLQKTIDYGMEAGERSKKLLKKPHDLEYEKTFHPFILLSKKRYVGNKFEDDIKSYKQTSMGIVLKRRDNAKIVKHVYGGVIDRIINMSDIPGSITFLKESLNQLLEGHFPIDQLIITKTLKGYYKEPDKIAHKVLADRMASRDPGNKPQSNDRIPFVYIETPKNVKLQGDKIENPKYIMEQGLKIDYSFYITNQIMKPVSQIYALILEDLKGFNKPRNYYQNLKVSLAKKQPDKKKLNDKIQDLRMKDVQRILFGEVLRICENRKNGAQEITKWFKPISKDSEISQKEEIVFSDSEEEKSESQEEETYSDGEDYMSDFDDLEIEID